MERILSEIKRHTQNVKIRELDENKLRVILSYIDEYSNYGNTGFITIKVEKDSNTYNLTITRQSPMGTNSVLCSYGQKYVTTNGYEKGDLEGLTDCDAVIYKIYKTLSAYKFF